MAYQGAGPSCPVKGQTLETTLHVGAMSNGKVGESRFMELRDGASLDLSLSGQRRYVHGGDLLDVLANTFRIEEPVALRIFKLTDEMIEIATSSRHPADLRAAFLAVGESGRTDGYWLLRHRGVPVTRRSDLSDEDILSGCVITKTGASLAHPDPARMGRIAVLMAVALLRELHPGGKWLLGDISCRCYFSPVTCVSVRLHHESARYVGLSVDADGADWGRLVLMRSVERTSGDARKT